MGEIFILVTQSLALWVQKKKKKKPDWNKVLSPHTTITNNRGPSFVDREGQMECDG